jgi:hypothetical protein
MIDRAITTPDQYKSQCWLVPGMRIVVVPRKVEIEKGIKKFSCTTGEMQRLTGNGQLEGSAKK